MAEMVARELTGEKIKVIIEKLENPAALGHAPPVKMWLDASKMRTLGWEPKGGLTEAYRRMAEWMA